MKKLWPFILNALLFAGVASGLPFLVLYYQSVGFTGAQIGLLNGMTPLIVLFSIALWTGLADATRRHRLIVGSCLLVAAIAMAALPLFNAFAPVLLIVALFSAFFAPVPAFTDNATMFMLGDEKEQYGRVRLGGTIGYGLAAVTAGALVQSYGLRWAFWGCAALLLVALLVSQRLAFRPATPGDSTPGSLGVLLSDRRWLLFLMVAFAGGVGFSAYNNYLFPYLRELGAPESTMGLSLTIGTLAEIPILFFGNRLIRRFGPLGLLSLAAAVTGLRLLLYAASSAVSLVLVVQLLNGLTFPAMWLAGVTYADEIAPAGLGATAQGHFGAMVFGFGPAVGGFIGGPLLASLGGHGLYLVFGIIVLGIAALATLARTLLPAGQRVPPTP
jgi:PPP family 3-phenylpropionic acid transporter